MEEEGWLEGGTRIAVDGSLAGADSPDPLIDRLTGLGADQLTAEIVTLREHVTDP